MGRMSQPVLPLLPPRARSIGPSVGLVQGPDGGVVWVFGAVTFTYAAVDEVSRRLAAVQLVTAKLASAVDVAAGFGVSVATLWRWVAAFQAAGAAGLVRDRTGPRGPSKLTAPLIGRIVALDAAGRTLGQIATATGVSTASVRVALGRVAPRPGRGERRAGTERGEPVARRGVGAAGVAGAGDDRAARCRPGRPENRPAPAQ